MTASYDDHPVERWWDYTSLIRTHANRWRLLQVVLMGIFGQFSGNGLAYYITIIFEQLGVKTVAAQLGYNILYSVVCAIGAVSGALLADHMPRRRVLTIGPAIMASLLAIFVGLNSMVSKYVNVDEEVPQPLARGALAMYMLFGAVIAFVYTPLQSLLPVEALSNSMRAKGLTVYTYTMGCMGFINMFLGPIGLYNIQYRYIAIFAAFDAFESVVWYFCGVESCGKTLEELDEVYEAPYPPAANGGAKLGVAARRMLGLRT
jgi:MFS family permease